VTDLTDNITTPLWQMVKVSCKSLQREAFYSNCSRTGLYLSDFHWGARVSTGYD